MVFTHPVKIRSVRIFAGTKLLFCFSVFLGFNSLAWSQVQDIGGKRTISVASLNLYLGAELGSVTDLDPADPEYFQKLVSGVAGIYGKIVASDYPKRADALAQEIVARGPDIVGLQEVSLFRRQSPGDLVSGGHVPATEVESDQLAILLRALENHGGHYAVAAQVQDIDIELPLITATGSFDDLRFTDHDVILVRTDLPPGQLYVSNPQGQNYIASIPLPLGANVLRGWASVDVWLRGRSLRFVSTHIENPLPPPLPDFQGFQALELLAGPANPDPPMPVILVGDFNADAHGNLSPEIYPLLIEGGGFADAWSDVHPGDPGLTWGHDELLSDPSMPLLYRLDLILYRGGRFHGIEAETVDPLIDTKPPLWFSDHAGLFATLSIK